MNARRMRGVYLVEFAIVGLLLFVVLFGALELGRLAFTVNALNETVRRGARLAAVCDISDPRVLRRAMFNAADSDSTTSSLIGGLDSSQMSLSYLDANGSPVASPGTATGFGQIRYVRLRVEGFVFDLLIPGMQQALTLPAFESTLPRESLGRQPDANEVPEITPC
ncbi:TadE/TadG family type IV pilus assembly protein [Pseudomonas oligotrophica]|uniref:TadE/TadG family type IV pilus assembly protein n=1 Tax=Pseudomonas oligotrophica TaxID=2912055 RepID=UPI001F44970E|nr:TadE family protein [Pseudomonas oligotrophica]MCF7202880.1 pilus assembly protein [Pseudomonas oligotrophica]